MFSQPTNQQNDLNMKGVGVVWVQQLLPVLTESTESS